MPTKVLIVDDSALMRRQLAEILTNAGFIVKTARNGVEAIAENQSWQPDVITLDINMPAMDGLTALAEIMTHRPVPVVMISSLTTEGAEATLEALALGAVDYIPKPGGTISLSLAAVEAEIVAKVKAAARAKLRVRLKAQARTADLTPGEAANPPLTVSFSKPLPSPAVASLPGLVLIGVSTGGPSTLEEILPPLPADYPFPILVAQHMPAAFTPHFAARLNNLCALNVVEVSAPTPIQPGTIYIGRGEADLIVSPRAGRLTAVARPPAKEYLWHPSVEALGRSVLEHCDPATVIAVMLTGMGYDGADAFTELKRRGARTIAESEETAVVFGMPRELIERGGATLTLPAHKIAKQLIGWARPRT
ncbi:MAG: chemotaxis-specific protein-glutamate methyltransferase CheB [Hydrogenophilus sp.]|nr:chemotaxis-specific protein-glutamate methyltransferase CheB [Hydrogenophilus sp.]